jgi:hypothetical protein
LVGVVVDVGRRVLVVVGDLGGHCGGGQCGWLLVFGEFGSPKLLWVRRCAVLCGDFLFGRARARRRAARVTGESCELGGSG